MFTLSPHGRVFVLVAWNVVVTSPYNNLPLPPPPPLPPLATPSYGGGRPHHQWIRKFPAHTMPPPNCPRCLTYMTYTLHTCNLSALTRKYHLDFHCLVKTQKMLQSTKNVFIQASKKFVSVSLQVFLKLV